MSNSIIYYLEVNPMPSNDAYGSFRQGRSVRRYLRPDYRDWKNAVKELCDLQHPEPLKELDEPEFLVIEVYIYWEWSAIFAKNGNLKKKDLSGHLKLLEDSLADHLELDDSANFRLIMNKIPSKSATRIFIKVSKLNSFDELPRLQV